MQKKTVGKSKVSSKQGYKLLHQMMLIRRFEEKSAEAYSQTKIRGFLHLYSGEEAVAVGVTQALGENDNVLSTYREHGHAIAKGLDPKTIMAEMYGKQEGCSRGRGGSMHLFDASKKFFGGSAIVGGHLPLAVGMALASKKQNLDNITCCFFGEGAGAEGEFHESMNLASLWKVPVLFVCENNLYAMGTAIRFTHSIQELEKRGDAYGIPSASVDGMDLLAVMDAAKKAVSTIKKTGGPYFLVCNTYRFRAHSMFDAELYREKSEVEEWKKKDPIPKFRDFLLKANLLSEEEAEAIEKSVEKEVDKAIDFAENGTWEDIRDLTKFVYSEKEAE